MIHIKKTLLTLVALMALTTQAWADNSEAITKVEIPYTTASSGSDVPVTWTASTRTASIAAMPAGDVTVDVEYYPQATVTGSMGILESVELGSTTPMVDITGMTVTGGKLLYSVTTSNTELGNANTSAKIPTAANSVTTPGTYYVWYCVLGTDEGVNGATATYSNSDYYVVGPITVTAPGAPATHNVTFNTEGLSTDEAGKWSAEPSTSVSQGTTVTVTYTGSKKVIGVSAKKKE